MPPHPGPRIGSLCSGYGGLDLAALDVLGGRLVWVADTPAIPRTAQLTALGNGVVPRQAAAALTALLTDPPPDLATHLTTLGKDHRHGQ